jgi:hypothetical protein
MGPGSKNSAKQSGKRAALPAAGLQPAAESSSIASTSGTMQLALGQSSLRHLGVTSANCCCSASRTSETFTLGGTEPADMQHAAPHAPLADSTCQVCADVTCVPPPPLSIHMRARHSRPPAPTVASRCMLRCLLKSSSPQKRGFKLHSSLCGAWHELQLGQLGAAEGACINETYLSRNPLLTTLH